MEECDSGVGVAPPNPGEQGGVPWAQPDTCRVHQTSCCGWSPIRALEGGGEYGNKKEVGQSAVPTPCQ